MSSPEKRRKHQDRVEIPIIASEFPALPEYELLEELIGGLDDEMWTAFTEQGVNGSHFYYPLLSFLESMASLFHDKAVDVIYRTKALPLEIQGAIEHSWRWDKNLIEDYYTEHPAITPQEKQVERLLQIKLWFNYLAGRLIAIIDEYSVYELLKHKGMTGHSGEEMRQVRETVTADDYHTFQRMWVETQMPNFRADPHQWNEFSLTELAQWLILVLDPKYRHGKPPYFIFIDAHDFPTHIPRAYRGKIWATGFGQRLIVVNLDLTAEQKDQMWGFLLVDEDIYGNEDIDLTARGEVFRAIHAMMPENAKVHLDLCGGKGDFIKWLKEQPIGPQSVLVDISVKAVEFAQQQGIQAQVGNAEEEIEIGAPVDVVTIIYAVQWINPVAFEKVLQVLKPGGMLLFNVYPPMLEEAERYAKILEEIGFVKVKIEQQAGQGKSPLYLIRAEKQVE